MPCILSVLVYLLFTLVSMVGFVSVICGFFRTIFAVQTNKQVVKHVVSLVKMTGNHRVYTVPLKENLPSIILGNVF